MKMTRMMMVAGTCAMLSLALVMAQEAKIAPLVAPAPVVPEQVDLVSIQKQIARSHEMIEGQLKEIQTRLDSMSKFLGDRNASTFDTVDRRLVDLKRDVDDIKNRQR